MMKKYAILFLLKLLWGKYKWDKTLKKEGDFLPRIARDYSEIKVYHIIIRGIDKQEIFFDEDDRYKFMNIIENTKEKYKYEIYSYCLMDNHVHFVIYDKQDKISKIMQSIQISYALYFNRKYERTGHLFQNRFFSKKIEDRDYLKVVCRYIHQNPLKAGIGRTEEYKWSSYKEYIKKSRIISSKLLLSIFSEDIENAKKEFIKYHNLDVEKSKQDELNDVFEYEMYEKLTDEEVKKCICELLDINNVNKILQSSNKIRNEYLVILKSLKMISIRQLSRVIGINRKIIERA